MNPSLVIGYHGCLKTVADDVISGRERHLKSSYQRSDWLGPGIYCWENSFHRAWEWACARASRSKDVEPAVIGIMFSPGTCLDLTDSKDIDTLDSVALAFQKYCEITGEPVPKRDVNGQHFYDCALIKFFHDFLKANKKDPIQTLRGAFPEGKTIANENSEFYRRHHIQWAIRDPEACVYAYFRPLNPEYEYLTLLHAIKDEHSAKAQIDKLERTISRLRQSSFLLSGYRQQGEDPLPSSQLTPLSKEYKRLHMKKYFGNKQLQSLLEEQ